MLRIDVWSVEKETMRSDLAIPLNQSGTGLGQILAIIYVAFAYTDSRVLLIDEPQSFLHPGAARKLIEVLKRFPQHQYIVSTHTAAIISAAEPREILILKNEGNETQIKVADANDNNLLAELLRETGTQLSDVFGMERVIWAEGPTEAKIFPKILTDLGKARTSTVVVPIRNTGDLETKDARRIFEIYNSLSSKASLLPQSVYFLLDRELRTEQDLTLLQNVSGGRAYFVPRRNIECFFLHADAIAGVCSNIGGFAADGQPTTEQVVQNWLNQALLDPKYWAAGQTPSDDPARLDTIDGASVLRDLFNSLSETRVSYRKTVHSVSLFDWTYQLRRDRLADLIAFLNETVE
jgi:energy-coupling factor transporter ATP-binding protein EcfA2